MYLIDCIVNRPVSSNCYVISEKDKDNCLVVDPGTEDCEELLVYLQTNKLYPEYIILTHEHVDHIIGCSRLKKVFGSKIICSAVCNEYMQLSKYNLTKFSEQFEGKSFLQEADILFDEMNFSLKWNKKEIHFYKAQGHSLGSIYFDIKNDLFIGDTLIKGFKTMTTLPGGSKEQLLVTLEQFLERYNPRQMTIYSGHFSPFLMQDIVPEINKQIEYLKGKILKQRNRNV